jgi:uncharacterized protein (DUF849 family)
MKTILSCAVTGNITTPQQHPGLPITPRQIADAAIEAAGAGAAIAHIHVRDPETGKPSMDVALYREVMERIRGQGSDIIINLTTGPGGRFWPSEHDPRVADPRSTLLPPDKRVEHVVALKPELCSLDLNTMWSGTAVVINTPANVAKMAQAMRAAGTKPELEVFDSGDIHLAHQLIADGMIEPKPLFQIVMGVRYGFAASPATLAYAAGLLPQGAPWAAFGIGRMEFPMVAQAFLLGGHVRVGMEDNIYIERGKLTPGNGALCEKAVRIVRDLGGDMASPAEARAILGLSPPGTGGP